MFCGLLVMFTSMFFLYGIHLTAESLKTKSLDINLLTKENSVNYKPHYENKQNHSSTFPAHTTYKIRKPTSVNTAGWTFQFFLSKSLSSFFGGFVILTHLIFTPKDEMSKNHDTPEERIERLRQEELKSHIGRRH